MHFICFYYKFLLYKEKNLNNISLISNLQVKPTIFIYGQEHHMTFIYNLNNLYFYNSAVSQVFNLGFDFERSNVGRCLIQHMRLHKAPE